MERNRATCPPLTRDEPLSISLLLQHLWLVYLICSVAWLPACLPACHSNTQSLCTSSRAAIVEQCDPHYNNNSVQLRVLAPPPIRIPPSRAPTAAAAEARVRKLKSVLLFHIPSSFSPPLVRINLCNSSSSSPPLHSSSSWPISYVHT